MKSTERIRRLVRLTGRERRQLVRAWCSLVLVGAALLVLRLRDQPGLSPLGLIGLEPPLERPGGRIVTALQRGIWTVDAATGERQRLRTIPTGRELSQVAWSPDGSRLAVSETAYPATQTLGIGGLYVVPTSGGEPTSSTFFGGSAAPTGAAKATVSAASRRRASMASPPVWCGPVTP